MPAAGALDSGRYEIGRLLGRGGLGEVYLAHDRTLGRDVAIKFLNPDQVGHADARRALLREARAAAALDHPYICTVYETGETPDGRGFIVMQYVEGETLSTVLQQGAMSVRDALTLCADIADALAAAHRRGVIHRDLKPGNIIVTPSGHPKLVDFGIAKVVLSRAQETDESTMTGTMEGLLVGTPAYMSPEQVQRHPVDGRSDLFSLGLVLFECLTGRRAFKAATAVEILADILHVYPPAPSSLRIGLSEAHDALCRQLIAKDPADRFQSADEVVGAIRVLVPDTSRTSSGATAGSTAQLRLTRRAASAALIAAIVGLAGIGGAWMWLNRGGLPKVPETSDPWYQRGTDALREGAYHRARTNLQQAVQIFQQHALALARLAEAEIELDDPQAATRHLVGVSQIVPDESRLPTKERLRLQAIRSVVLRQGEPAVSLYRQLVQLSPGDAGALVDLGRAQEMAQRRADARTSYEQAIKTEPHYAPAYLRLGKLEGSESRREQALSAYREAERLYDKSQDLEGQAEVFLSRGTTLIAIGVLKEARTDLERALQLSKSGKWVYQQIRARIALGSVAASEGRYADAERMTSEAVEDALANRLETVAAEGLIELTGTLSSLGQFDKAEASALKGIALAEGRGASRIRAQAKAQLAEVYSKTNRAQQAVAMISEVLPVLRHNLLRRLELTSLQIATRARESLDQLEQARRDAHDLLKVAEELKEETPIATAATTVALVLASLGDYPEALRQRDRAEAIQRRQGDRDALPFTLTNRADLLIRLGRSAEATKLLDEIDAGIAAGIDSYKNRRRRAISLRALDAAIALRCRDALTFLDSLQRETAPVDLSARVAPSLRAFCESQSGLWRGPSTAFPEPSTATADASTLRERHYWLAAAALQRRDWKTAASEAAAGLKLLAGIDNAELRWRLAAVAASAARALGDAATAQQMSTTARDAYERLRTSYQADFTTYERRLDLADLRKKEQTR